MTEPSMRTARVMVDVTGIHKTFDYLVPADATNVLIGTEVRVRLGPRHVRGWIIALDVDAPPDVKLQPVKAIRGVGPGADVVELANWAAWRWAGHPAQLLRVASAPSVISALPPSQGHVAVDVPDQVDKALVDDALSGGATTVRLPPAFDRAPFVIGLLASSLDRSPGASAIVACPGLRAATRLVTSLRAAGFPVADLAADGPDTFRSRAWADGAAGGRVVVGTRNAAWVSAPDLAVAVIVDEHDEAFQSTRMPTWHARDVLAERARHAGVPFVALSPCPSLEALTRSRLITSPRAVERAGWPTVEVLDRRDEDPSTASSLFSDRLASLLAGSGRVVAVVNRTGRVRLLGCRACGALARCERCGASVHSPADTELVCPRCADVRPRVCDACGSGSLKNLRIGVARAREELEALIGEPVAEITGETSRSDRASRRDLTRARVVIGTEAVLHRVGPVSTVVFLDFDQELTAPRFRAAEQSFALLARGARLLGPRRSGNRLIIQTRLADHPVVVAAASGDPDSVSAGERNLREQLGFPPYTALALVSGAGGADFVRDLDGSLVDVLDGGDGTWLVRAGDPDRLAGALAAVPRPEARLRIEVDPLRV